MVNRLLRRLAEGLAGADSTSGSAPVRCDGSLTGQDALQVPDESLSA